MFFCRKKKVTIPPVHDLERERSIEGLRLQHEALLTSKLAGEIQEALAQGALLRFRNDP